METWRQKRYYTVVIQSRFYVLVCYLNLCIIVVDLGKKAIITAPMSISGSQLYTDRHDVTDYLVSTISKHGRE